MIAEKNMTQENYDPELHNSIYKEQHWQRWLKTKLILPKFNPRDTVNLEFFKILKLYSRIISMRYTWHLFVKYRNGSHLNLNVTPVTPVHCKNLEN